MPNLRSVTEKYYRAIWALDSLGQQGRREQYWLMLRWQKLALMVDIENEFVDAEVRGLAEHASAAISNYEKEGSYSTVQKNYLLGVISRCLRAISIKQKPAPSGWSEKFFRLFRRSAVASQLTAEECAYLNELCSIFHYYAPSNEHFHADLGIGYYLWQGIRAELKNAITLANLDGSEPKKVAEIADAIRSIIAALEHNEPERLRHYQKSQLNLSVEDYGRLLSEAIIKEMKTVLAEAGRSDPSKFLA